MLPIAKMLLDPDVFSIGIHVRTDYTDSAMKGGDGAKSVADYWTPFQCAKVRKGKQLSCTISNTGMRPSRRVLMTPEAVGMRHRW